MPPPPCVQNGARVFPEKLYVDKKVATGGAMVLYQFGVPTKIMSYFPKDSGGEIKGGLYPRSISPFD